MIEMLISNKETDQKSIQNYVSLYKNKISEYELLSLTQEIDLSKRLHYLKTHNKKSNSNAIKNKTEIQNEVNFIKKTMIQSNLNLVVNIVEGFQNRGMSYLDLVEVGNLGLTSAIDHYDYNKGCRISTYASWWIKQAIYKALSDNNSMN